MKKFIKTGFGFSLVEFMVAVSITGIVVIPVTLYFSSTSQKTQKQLEKSTANISNLILAQNLITNDLSSAGPSYNFLQENASPGDVKTAPRDCENIKRTNFWEKTDKNSCTPLEIKLSRVGDEFIFMKLVEAGNHHSLHFTPNKFYSLSSAITRGSSVNFLPNDFVSAMMKIDPVTKKTVCTDKDYLKVASLGGFTQQGGPSAGKAMQYAIIVPCVNEASRLTTLDSPFLAQYFRDGCKDKAVYTGVKNLDMFFRCMPVVGGLANTLAEPVEFIRYRVVETKKIGQTNKVLQLIREKVQLQAGTKNVIVKGTLTLFDGFSSVTFMRASTSQSLIKFRIDRDKNS